MGSSIRESDIHKAARGRAVAAETASSATVTLLPPRQATTALRKPRGQLALGWRQFRRHRLAIAASVILGAICVAAAAAPWISPYDPNKTDLLARLEPPSTSHWFGTDDLGRDELTRILWGGRISLMAGVLTALVAIVVGTLVGAVAGYFGGRIDNLLMRFTDLVIALPQLFLLILLASLVGTSLLTVVLVIGALRWMPVARLVRASVLSLKEQDYVIAARALGAPSPRIIARHILPNALSPIIVAATLGVAGAIITESALSFLGLGIQPPTATWGNMLRTAQDVIETAPWTAFFPGLMIFLTVLSINYIGDGLRDALDPHKSR
jgi:peptide/nickel transport system permease protein